MKVLTDIPEEVLRPTPLAPTPQPISIAPIQPIQSTPLRPRPPLPTDTGEGAGRGSPITILPNPPMSWLSQGLSALGIGKGVQQAALTGMATTFGGPGLGAVVSAATAAAKAGSPFAGVVKPGGSQFINQTFGLGPTTGGMVPRGYHISKRTGKIVRNRHMNFANGRAIRRATRRLKGAEKMFRKVLTVQHGAVHGHIRPKRGKR